MQYNLYANPNVFEYGQMQPICAYNQQEEHHFNAYVDKYMGKIRNKTCSEVYILVMKLDPANGVTEVLRNDYVTNPLKLKIEINVAAKRPKSASFATMTFDEILDNPSEDSEDD